MPKRMLIDASHPEETRVVVLDGQKVEEFDFEAASKRPLKGNIYLAKVTRVEPSLQAAFVEYGGNRQGFLAFSEIHPDYYQIPVADRIALLAEQEADAKRRSDDDVESFEIAPGPKPDISDESEEVEASSENSEDAPETADASESASSDVLSDGEDGFYQNRLAREQDDEHDDHDHEDRGDHQAGADELVEASQELSTSEFIALEESEVAQGVVDTQSVAEAAFEMTTPAQPLQAQRPAQRHTRKRHYKIQEVIKRRQIILVQVVKEERGNKGAALTTYLSLAGRYCVLMPNTPRGGGISRKITNANDRKRLKSAAQALELPEGMGLIIRTAGENRTKVEIKRDYEYLLRMWDTIRELTLKSNAPACVYEEGDLVKRAIRDLYNKDVTDIVVEGEDGYRNAKDFMRMLMPSHAKNVKPYKEAIPLFQRHHIEAQLDSMFSPTVTLKSGGYIVINQTEALVSVDVNSGRATREHSIEDTARKTNLEAADEVGRQLRLRDLAGLIVIDFIDMEDSRNDREVEKRIRDAVKNDRARVQIGKISQFGLLEMSRQRLRAGVVAGSTVPCPHCGGQGIVRSVESTALRVLRSVEEEGQKLKASAIMVRVASDVAIYTLNQKRRELARIESDYGMAIMFEPKDGLMVGTFEIETITLKTAEEMARVMRPATEYVVPAELPEPEDDVISEQIEADPETASEEQDSEASSTAAPSTGTPKRRRRRRGGRGHSDRPPVSGQPADAAQSAEPQLELGQSSSEESGSDSDDQEGAEQTDSGAPATGEGAPRKKRRRRRGRRGGSSQGNGESAEMGSEVMLNGVDRFGTPDEIDTTPRDEARPMLAEPLPEIAIPIAVPNAASTPVWSLTSEQSTPEPVATLVEIAPKPVAKSEPVSVAAEAEEPSGPPKKGWWQRTFRAEP